MSNSYKKCPNGHFYQGDTCPYCETELFPLETVGMRTDLHTSVVPPGRETVIFNIPFCPHCKKKVKNSIPHPDWPIVGSIDGNAYDGKVPWNYKWDGRCENCGHDFSITMIQRINTPYNDRLTILRSSDRRIQEKRDGGFDSPDAFIGLSGIEIEQRNSTDSVQKVFISTNELKYLLDALKNSPFLEQLDWHEDYT